MEKLYYDRENKKFYVKELDSVNNVVTDEQYVDVTDEIVTLIQEHVTKDGKKVICFSISGTEMGTETLRLTNAKGDSETFAEHSTQDEPEALKAQVESGEEAPECGEELCPVLPGATDYGCLSDSLALAFSRYLDSNRVAWKMCLSAMECEEIMRAFRRQDWKTIERYRMKYLFNEND